MRGNFGASFYGLVDEENWKDSIIKTAQSLIMIRRDRGCVDVVWGACAVLADRTSLPWVRSSSWPMECSSLVWVTPAGQRKRPRHLASAPLSLQIDERFDFPIFVLRWNRCCAVLVPGIVIMSASDPCRPNLLENTVIILRHQHTTM